MATIRKRGDKWQVQVRRDGHPNLSKTFLTRRHAETWAHDVELAIERQEVLPSTRKDSTETVGELLVRYRATRTKAKKSATVEGFRIGKMLRDPISRVNAVQLTPAQVAHYRDNRLTEVSSETVRQDLVLLRQVCEIARREWGIPLRLNPVDEVRKPDPAPHRDRRVAPSEIETLCIALGETRNKTVANVIAFALATGMRRGEILRAKWQDIDFKGSVLRISITKTGRSRIIPLTPIAIAVLNGLSACQNPDRVIFPVTANAFRLAWQRLVKRSGITNLRFHDFRHEAISRFFEAGLSLPEVALISGHRDARQLMRYTHLDATRVAQKLRGTLARLSDSSHADSPPQPTSLIR